MIQEKLSTISNTAIKKALNDLSAADKQALTKHKIPLDTLSPAAKEIAERQYKCMLLMTCAPVVDGKVDLTRVEIPAVHNTIPEGHDNITKNHSNSAEQMVRLTCFPALFSKVAPVQDDGSIDPKYFRQFLGAFQKLVEDKVIYFGTLFPPSYMMLPVVNGIRRAVFFFFAFPHPELYEGFVEQSTRGNSDDYEPLHIYLNRVSSVKGFVPDGTLGDEDWSALPQA